ncbi:MAG: hypothetical protein ACLQBD_01135 [Syntrophobacteraceae bacterium]
MNEGSASFGPLDISGGLQCPWFGAFTMAMNLPSEAVSEYQFFPFNSACVFNGVPLACGHDGIYQLETGDDDADVQIDAVIQFPKTNFGSSYVKRFRYLYIRYRAEGDLALDLTADDGTTQSFTLPATLPGQHSGVRIPVSTIAQGVYWTLALRNLDGNAFSLDGIDALMIVTSKRFSTGY